MAEQRELKKYVLEVAQAAANTRVDVSLELPKNKKLLLKQVLLNPKMLTNVADTDALVEVELYTRKSLDLVYAPANLIFAFSMQQATDITGYSITDRLVAKPFVWTPPPGLYLYGSVLSMSLRTAGMVAGVMCTGIVYGTLSAMDDIEQLQKTAVL